MAEGQEAVHHDPRSGQCKTQRIEANLDSVQKPIGSDRRLSLRMMAKELDMNRETVQQILTENLGMRKADKEAKQEAKKLITKSAKAPAKAAPKQKSL